MSASAALSFVQAYTGERDYTVWADMSSKLQDFDVVLSNTDFYPLFEAFLRSLYSSVGEALGWDTKEGEAHTAPMLRSLVINRLAKYGDAKTVEEAKKRFANYLKDPSSLSPDLRTAVYATVLRTGDESTFNQLLDIYRKAELQEEKQRVLQVLGVSPTEELLEKTLTFIMSDEVRTQDRPTVIMGIGSNRKGRELCWKFIQSNWSKLTTMYEGGFLLARIVKTTSQFASEAKAAEVEEFFKSNPTPGIERTVKQTLETIRLNASRLKKDEADLKEWLQKNYGK